MPAKWLYSIPRMYTSYVKCPYCCVLRSSCRKCYSQHYKRSLEPPVSWCIFGEYVCLLHRNTLHYQDTADEYSAYKHCIFADRRILCVVFCRMTSSYRRIHPEATEFYIRYTCTLDYAYTHAYKMITIKIKVTFAYVLGSVRFLCVSVAYPSSVFK